MPCRGVSVTRVHVLGPPVRRRPSWEATTASTRSRGDSVSANRGMGSRVRKHAANGRGCDEWEAKAREPETCGILNRWAKKMQFPFPNKLSLIKSIKTKLTNTISVEYIFL